MTDDGYAARVAEIVQRVPVDDRLVLPVLQQVQEELGFVPPSTLDAIADLLNVSRATVFGVLTFYTDLRTTPPPDTSASICMGEACQAQGARALWGGVHGSLDPGAELSRVFCLGNCALGPCAVVGGRLIGRATVQDVQDAMAATPMTEGGDARAHGLRAW